MFIDGIGISGYRSFGSNLQKIGPFGKINLFIGQNNSGKSNILLFLTQKYKLIAENPLGPNLDFNSLDYHIGANNEQTLQLATALKIGGENHKLLCESLKQKFEDHYIQNRDLYSAIEQILKSKMLSAGEDTAWFPYRAQPQGTTSRNFPSGELVEQLLSEEVLKQHEWRDLWNSLQLGSAKDLKRTWIPEVLRLLFLGSIQKSVIRMIPANRDATAALDDAHDKINIIAELAQRQNPVYDKLHLKEEFETINGFLQEVMGNRTARLEIPYTQEIIQVNIDGKTLPLSHLGMGINKTIILAVIATIRRNEVLCIEEPEENLHPLAQKKLIRYLAEKTDNQYFIATHSPHFLDLPDAHVFHVRLEHGQSVVEAVQTSDDKFSICADLGYRASDLLQTNCIIWVEGPSDRIYINHWIKSVDNELVEEVHYSIMFYGGSTQIKHLSADDPTATEFISLLRLNRNAVIIIDSDKSGPSDSVKPDVERISKEFNHNGKGFGWITAGPEVENYVEEATFIEAVKSAHPNIVRDSARLVETGRFADLFHWETAAGKTVKPRKVKVAYEVVKQPANLKVLDLETQVKRLVEFIHRANAF